MKSITFPVALSLLASTLFSLSGMAAEASGAGSADATAETAPPADLSSTELQPGPAAIVGNNVNIRAQATINSEVVTQLQDGTAVTVEEIILRTSTKGQDPARWAQITYPANAMVWVHGGFINSADQTVKPGTLNVRSGPGENYTVVATLKSGDVIVATGSKGDWISIAPPAGARAFVAAKLIKQTLETTEVAAATPLATNVTPSDPEVTPVATTTPIPEDVTPSDPEVTSGATTTPEAETSVSTWDPNTQTQRTDVVTFTPLPDADPDAPVDVEEEVIPRVVQREGIVRSFTSIQAPSFYKLVSVDNGKTINYLHTTTTNLDLGRYVGLHIVATGEESLDERWPNMPVLTLKRIIVLE
jgi:uncharacterized protein YgiM (DUF1202 family)